MAQTHQYHSPEEMRDSIESLFGAHGRGRPYIYWALLVVCLAGIVALPLVKVDTSVGAPGQIRPAVERFPVYSAASGRIAQIRVRDNQPVFQGEPLLEIDSSAIDARLAETSFELRDNALALGDLDALLGEDAWKRTLDAIKGTIDAVGDDGTAEATRLPPFPALALEHPAYLRQEALLTSDLARLSLNLEGALRKLSRFQALHRKDLLSQQQFEDQVYAAQAILREVEITIQRALNNWQSDRAERVLKAAQLESAAEQLEKQRELYAVVAPIDGIAIGFTGLHEGLFLSTDQAIGEISPSGRLQADVFLRPGDIGFVQVDQVVNLQVEAFPYTEWGTVQGRVQSLSQDFVQVGSQMLFRAIIDLESTELSSSAGATVELRRGMTVQARFILQRRSLFDLLFGKMSESLDPRTHPDPS